MSDSKYRLEPSLTQIHPEALVAPHAVIVGDVTIGARANVWYKVVIRGDTDHIEVGEGTSVRTIRARREVILAAWRARDALAEAS